MQHKIVRLLVAGIVGLLILASSFSLTQSALAQTEFQPKIQGSDFSSATLRLEDLPSGFEPSGEWVLGTIDVTLTTYQMLMFHTDELIPSPIYGTDDIVNLTGFRSQDNLSQDVIYSWMVTSLSRSEQSKFDQAFANPDEFIQSIQRAHEDNQAHKLSGYENIGNTRLAYTYNLNTLQGQDVLRYERVIVRRGPVLIEIQYHYRDGDQPLLNTIELARLLDSRVIAIVGEGNDAAFRPAGPLVPELTTSIPTPLDVSTQPGVVGTNLLLAALLMLPFAIAAELFTRTLGEHEDTLKKFRAFEWISKLQKKWEEKAETRIAKQPLARDTAKLVGIILFYGLVFSLLDRTWNPFSLAGLILFISMTIAYGIVGIADDIIQWRVIRKWGLAADLTLRPTNLLLAMGSTATSRLLTLIPGLMFGTPEALRTDESQFDESKQNRLLKISALTFVLIGLGVWLPTIATTALQKTSLPVSARDLIGGLEGFLLVIFAVTLENLFVQMLGFPGGFGQALKRKNKWLWLTALTGVTFLFYHTLINPRGELAEALQQANIWLFFGIAIAFVIFAFGLHYSLQKRGTATETQSHITLTERPVTAKSDAVVAPASPSIEIGAKPIVVPIAETKQCPVCCNQIKAEAKLCRYCKSTFSITKRGYCPADHEPVVANEDGKCVRCGSDVVDLHVESRLLKTGVVEAARVVEISIPAKPKEVESKPGADEKTCPACGKTIKAEARICRFCRARFEVRGRGYCLTDHAIVDVVDGKCVRCGNEAKDVHLESKLIAGEVNP